jgi:NDP-sugar pyrophosphorylase family protein
MSSNAVTRKVRGVILAGQYAWNDSTFDALCPRPLLPVANQPLVCYALLWLHEGGVREAAVCANRETRVAGARLKQYAPSDVSFALLEDLAPRGPAGCVRDAAGDAQTLVVVDGTTVPLPDLRTLLASHRASGAALTVVVHAEPGRDGKGGRQVPSGIYVFERRALEHVSARGFCDIKESLIPRLYRAGERTLTHPVRESSPRVHDGPSYLELNGWMVERLVEAPPAPGFVRASARQGAPDATCAGPVLVGPGAQVMSGATLVGPTSIGPGSIVAQGALLSRSAVWRRCRVGEGAVADGCILADDSVLAPRGRAFGSVRAPEPGRRPAVFPFGTVKAPPSYRRIPPQPGPALSSTE